MKVFVVTGHNGLLKTYGPVGVGETRKAAEVIVAKYEYMLDESLITEMELQTDAIMLDLYKK